jgi:hypothetical protein
MVEQTVVQPVLIDGGQFVAQPSVEVLDNLGITFHDAPPKKYSHAPRPV